MKIFITGATGFIGKQVVNILDGTNHELFCLVRDTGKSQKLLLNNRTHLVKGDIRDKASVLKGMQGCDVVIHLAGLYSLWEPDNKLYEEINVIGTQNVMESALEAKVQKVIHVSTVVIYGAPESLPFNEESIEGNVRFSRYAETKYQGDKVVWDLYKHKALPVVVIYPGVVLGAADTKTSAEYISRLVNRQLPAMVFKNSILTWVYVKDVALAILNAMEKQGNIGERYIVAKHRLSLDELNRMVSEISGTPLPSMYMPGSIAMANAYLFTGISNIIKKKPLWGMSVDQMKTLKKGFSADGSKAEKELGISYTPIRVALEEEIAAIKGHESIQLEKKNSNEKIKVLIATFSQRGSTRKIADKIAFGLINSNFEVTHYTIKGNEAHDISNFDIIGIGTPTFFFKPPFVVQDFVKKLEGIQNKASFVFITYGSIGGHCGSWLLRHLRKKGALNLGYFKSRGPDYWMGYVKRSVLFSPESPTGQELAQAEQFGKDVAIRYRNNFYEPVEPDTALPFVYRIEKMLMARPLTKVYIKAFHTDKNCNQCGICVKNCPTGSLTMNGKVKWHSDCILCMECEMSCPKDAIHSTFDWKTFDPFMNYNIKHSKRNNIPFKKVVHKNGQTVVVE